MNMDDARCDALAEVFAFLGNSLLAPMNRTGGAGLDPVFWDSFPRFGNDGVTAAIDACRRFAAKASSSADPADAVQSVSVEYTGLFIGPPKPAAPPWETFYRSEGVTAGFGEPTFEMQRLLRGAGLEIASGNNQYADHIGIELLYASVLCQRRDLEALESFLEAHLRAWAGSLLEAVRGAYPGGYYENVVALVVELSRCPE